MFCKDCSGVAGYLLGHNYVSIYEDKGDILDFSIGQCNMTEGQLKRFIDEVKIKRFLFMVCTRCGKATKIRVGVNL